LAAENGHLPVVQYLCEQGVDKEARGRDGETPLQLAGRNVRVVRLGFGFGLRERKMYL